MAEHTNCGKQVQRVGMVSLKIGILYYTEIECRNFLREIFFNTFSYTDGPFFTQNREETTVRKVRYLK
jgi:hypothetical protein